MRTPSHHPRPGSEAFCGSLLPRYGDGPAADFRLQREAGLILFLLSLIGAGLQGCGGGSGAGSSPQGQVPSALYRSVLGLFSTQNPGYGPRAGGDPTPMHLPAAYAEYARAEAHRYRATGDQTALTNALGAADWLESNTDLDGDGELGWGLPYAWDASGDGVVNPPNTEYLIDTAFAIEALLEVREAALAAGETERAAAFLNAALGAATTFASGKFERDATGIVFWYSSLPHDNFPNVNSSAAFVGQLQRLSRFPSPRAQQFAQLADEGAAYLLARRETQQGVPFWRYNGWDVPTWPQNKPNDLSHEVATFDGLLTYKDYGGAHGSAVDPESFLDSLSRFVQPDRPHEFPLGFPYPAEVQADMEARWPKISAVGYALYFAARQERLINRPAVHTQALREALFRDYRTGDHWRYRPEDAQIVDGVPSQMAGVLLGLSYDEF